jgi:hypothetical protein
MHTLPTAPRTTVVSEHPYTVAYFTGANMYITESWQFKTCTYSLHFIISNTSKFQHWGSSVEQKKEATRGHIIRP